MVDCGPAADNGLCALTIDGLASEQILLTGATGFVGRRLLRQLLAAGVPAAALRCLVRDRDAALQSGLPGSSLCCGDVTDAAGLQRVVDGVSLVFHAAGQVKAFRRRGFLDVNAGGTAALAAALRARAPRARLVLVSSLAAAGPSIDGSGTDAPPERCQPVSCYGESKRQGELAALGAGLETVIVRPPAIYGPGDAATRLLFRQARAPLAALPWRKAPLSIAHVDDVVAVLVAAAAAPAGAILPIDGPERTDTHALLPLFAAACGRRLRTVRVPAALATSAAAAADLLALLRRRAGFFSRDKLREVHAVGWVADGRAAAALAPPRIALAPGLRQVAEQEGLLPKLTSATA